MTIEEGRTCRFLATEPELTTHEPRDEPLEPHRNLHQTPSQVVCHAVDEAGGDQGLAHGRVGGPLRPMGEQVVDRHGQEGIGIHETEVRGDDAVPVGVGIVAGGDVVGILVGDEGGHGIGRGAVHPDLAVGVQGHESPGRIDLGVDDGEVQSEVLGNVLPVLHRGTAQRIGADVHPSLRDGIQVEGTAQVIAVGTAVVEPGDLTRDRVVVATPDPARGSHEFVGTLGDPARGIRAGRATVWGVVLETSVAWRIVRWGDDDAVGLGPVVRAVVHDDGPGDGWGGGPLVLAFGDDLDVIGTQHLDRRAPGGIGQGVGVLADVQRTGDGLAGAVLDDGLGGRGDVKFVEGAVEGGASMSGGAEDHLLIGILRVRDDVVVCRKERVHVDEV